MCLIQEALQNPQPSASTTTSDMEWVDCGNPNIEINPIDIESETSFGSKDNRSIDKKIQVRKKDFQASKITQTDPISKICVANATCSSIKPKVSHAKTSPIKENVMTAFEASSYKEDISENEDDI